MLGKKSQAGEAVGGPARGGLSGEAPGSVVSKAMRIKGDCVVEGTIRIEGSVAGSVRARGLVLTESGSIEGDLFAFDGKKQQDPFVVAGRVDGAVRAPKVEIRQSGAVLKGVEADEVHVRGRIEGGILARERLVLEESAVVEGDVRARTLALKEGGQVNGTIVMGDRAALEKGSSGRRPKTEAAEADEVAELDAAAESEEAVAKAG